MTSQFVSGPSTSRSTEIADSCRNIETQSNLVVLEDTSVEKETVTIYSGTPDDLVPSAQEHVLRLRNIGSKYGPEELNANANRVDDNGIKDAPSSSVPPKSKVCFRLLFLFQY